MSVLTTSTIIGRRLVLVNLNLTCEQCNKIFINVGNFAKLVKKESDYDVFQLLETRQGDICQCLVDKLNIYPYVKLYSSIGSQN